MAVGKRNGMMVMADDDEEEVEFGASSDSDSEMPPYLGELGSSYSDSEMPPYLEELGIAAHSFSLDALRLALDNLNGSIDQRLHVCGVTALHLTCRNGHLPSVQLLLERGASLEPKDEDGAIPLHEACAKGFTQIVQLLLDKANDTEHVMRMLQTVDVEGDTPLHYAARGEYVGVIRLLLSYGASPTRRNVFGKTPSELAKPGSEVRSILETAASSTTNQQ